VKDLSLIVEFQSTLRMKLHDKLMNALLGDAKTFNQIRPTHRPIECIEQAFRGRTGNELPEPLAPQSPLRVGDGPDGTRTPSFGRMPPESIGPSDEAGLVQPFQRGGDGI